MPINKFLTVTVAPRLMPLLLSTALAGCATPAMVFVSRNYKPNQVHRVALMGFEDYPGTSGSGEVVASTFEKYLLLGDYSLVERRQVKGIIKEQSLQLSGAVSPATIRKLGQLLGVDALVFGNVTDFRNMREHTVMVDISQEHSTPVYGKVVTTQKSGDTTIKTVQNIVTGYDYYETNQIVPEVQTVPAHVGISVRLVDVQSGEVLWSASASSDSSDLSGATEEASSKIMEAVTKQLKKGS